MAGFLLAKDVATGEDNSGNERYGVWQIPIHLPSTTKEGFSVKDEPILDQEVVEVGKEIVKVDSATIVQLHNEEVDEEGNENSVEEWLRALRGFLMNREGDGMLESEAYIRKYWFKVESYQGVSKQRIQTPIMITNIHFFKKVSPEKKRNKPKRRKLKNRREGSA
jgi:hypothetical protein